MIQCKDSIVILRRSEDRRRICNLSPNRSFAYAQDDKVGLSRWGGRSRGACPATAGCLRASAGQGCGPHGSKEPRCTGNCSKNHCSAPSAAFLSAIAIRACCGLPPRYDGSPGGRRRERELLVFFAFFRFGVCRECPVALSVGGAPDGQRYVGVPVGRRSRALRPSICRSCMLLSVILPPSPAAGLRVRCPVRKEDRPTENGTRFDGCRERAACAAAPGIARLTAQPERRRCRVPDGPGVPGR